MATKQYIMAIVRIPMEVLPDATIEPVKDRIHVEFDTCDQLPPPTDAASNYEFLFNNVDFYLSKPSVSPALVVQSAEIMIRPKPGNRNTTFKNKMVYAHRTTSKRPI